MSGTKGQLEGVRGYQPRIRVHPAVAVGLGVVGVLLVGDLEREDSLVRPWIEPVLEAVAPSFDKRHRAVMAEIERAIAATRASVDVRDEEAAVRRVRLEFGRLGWCHTPLITNPPLPDGEPEWMTWHWQAGKYGEAPWVGFERGEDGGVDIVMDAHFRNRGRGDRAVFAFVPGAGVGGDDER
ncbi:MAG: hypothetical protein ACTS3F_10275 [Phycisphaerales bacterium]